MKTKNHYAIRSLLVLILLLCSVCKNSSFAVNSSSTASIQFCGAAQMVGGACYLIDTGNTRLLIDFGLFYGAEDQKRNSEIPFDPATISYLILSHAHIDHSGRIPLLYRKGFNGKIIATDATKSITGVMLEMSLGIQEEQGMALFSREDLARTMHGFLTVPYDQPFDITNDVSVKLRDSGHILGAATVELTVKSEGRLIKIVSTGDMGTNNNPLLNNPSIVTEGDYVLIESTYGTTKRKQESFDAFGKDIQDTINAGGSVLIPAFVLEKTQKVLYVIGALKRKGIIHKDVPVIADSSTGKDITRIYRKYTKYYNKDSIRILKDSGDPLSFSSLHEAKSGASLRNHSGSRPAIYLTSSGMLDHANAPKHLEKMVDNPKNLLVIVGWQAPDSVGRKLQDGAKIVQIPITKYINGKKRVEYVEKQVKLTVKKYSQFSSHMDSCEALKWLSNMPKTKKVFVIHGERENAIALAEAIKIKVGFDAIAPYLGETKYLKAEDMDFHRKSTEDLCVGLGESHIINTIADQ